MLIPSLTTTSRLPAISDKTSTSGFLVALNELLGGDSNERIQGKRNIREKSPADATEWRLHWGRYCFQHYWTKLCIFDVYVFAFLSYFIFVLSMYFVELSHASHSVIFKKHTQASG